MGFSARRPPGRQKGPTPDRQSRRRARRDFRIHDGREPLRPRGKASLPRMMDLNVTPTRVAKSPPERFVVPESNQMISPLPWTVGVENFFAVVNMQSRG